MVREAYKENNKPVNGFRTFVNVLRPIRDWLHTMKSSTPISSPISSTTNNISGHNNHNTSGSNSYNQESLAGRSSVDVLSSTTLPTPIHRYTPIVNGYNAHSGHTNNGSINGGVHPGMMTMDDLNGSTSGNGSAMESQFSRNAQARMSLPIMQQNKLRRQAYTQLQRRGQQVPRSLGHIYLQHKGETKQATLPNELTTIDTIRALFVCAFPRMLSMEYMSQPHVKIYIYNPSCNIFYELCDIDEVKHESVLRIHHSDPLIPLALPPQQMPPLHNQHYATIHRLPPRVAPQLPPPPMPPHLIAQPPPPTQQQQQQQQQQHMQPHQQQLTSQHHLQQHPHQQHHHLQLQLSQHQSMTQMPLSQIPPPKPRRMIPASYSMHRLNPQ